MAMNRLPISRLLRKVLQMTCPFPTNRVTHSPFLPWAQAFGCAAFAITMIASFCVALPSHAAGQSAATSDQGSTPLLGLPIRAPGYELFYHDNSSASAFANRWGYYDGWSEGRHDRQVGVIADATDHDKYKLAPDHGQHPGLDRDTYKSLYRIAYLRGYDRGSKE